MHRPRAERDFLLLAVDTRDPRGAPGQELRREVPEGCDELRLDQLDLAKQMRLAGRDLFGKRIAVPRGAALQHVGDEYVGSRETDPAEQRVEQLSRLPDKRHALLVLVEAGGLADEHEVCVRAPRAEDHLRASLRERTLGARGRLLRVLAERRGTLDDVHRTGSLRRGPDAFR